MKKKVALYLFALLVFASCNKRFGPAVRPVPELVRVVPDIAMRHTYLGGDSLQLFFMFEDRQMVMKVSEAATQLTYEVKAGANDRDAVLQQDTLQFNQRRMTDAAGGLYATIAVPAALVRSPNVVHLQLWQQLGKEERMGSIFQIPLQTNMLSKNYLLVHARTNQPVIRGYATTTDQLKIIGSTDSVYTSFQFFDTAFSPALPPMSTRTEPQPRTLQATDTISVKAGKAVQLEREGLYLIGTDEMQAEGLLVQPWSYPDVTMARELIAPLIYLTTSEEREKLTNAPDSKQAVDLFWQQVGGNTTIARELIREFYGRVEAANKLYTSHKQGWATDRGMIRIVFGKPDEVNRTGDKETWTYRQTRTRPYIKFVFTKKQNTFTENHYELVRLRDYQEVWYSTVAKWRAGITEM